MHLIDNTMFHKYYKSDLTQEFFFHLPAEFAKLQEMSTWLEMARKNCNTELYFTHFIVN